MTIQVHGRMPRWARNIAQREADATHGGYLSVRWMKCGRGCPHGRAFRWRSHIRCYTSGRKSGDRSLLIHELAHLADRSGGPSHGPNFYREAIRIARNEGCLRAFLNWQGRRAKTEYRRMLREERDAATVPAFAAA